MMCPPCFLPPRGALRGWCLLFIALHPAVGEPEPAKPSAHRAEQVEGWTVHVDTRVLEAQPVEAFAAPLEILRRRLAEVRFVLPGAAVARLQKVPIWLDASHGKLKSAQYHPSAGWLKNNGYDPVLAKAVHIPSAADYARVRHHRIQPWSILHELAHAYHDQVLGFEHPEIKEAWQVFRDGRKYDKTLHIEGGKVRHYALTDQKEFFAEMTEAYFGVNDFYPFNRAELKQAEPELFEKMARWWSDAPADRPPAPAAQPSGGGR